MHPFRGLQEEGWALCLDLFAELVLLSIQCCLRGMFLSRQSPSVWAGRRQVAYGEGAEIFPLSLGPGAFLAQPCPPHGPQGLHPRRGLVLLTSAHFLPPSSNFEPV